MAEKTFGDWISEPRWHDEEPPHTLGGLLAVMRMAWDEGFRQGAETMRERCALQVEDEYCYVNEGCDVNPCTHQQASEDIRGLPLSGAPEKSDDEASPPSPDAAPLVAADPPGPLKGALRLVNGIRNDRTFHSCYCGGDLPPQPLRCGRCREGILLDRISVLVSKVDEKTTNELNLTDSLIELTGENQRLRGAELPKAGAPRVCDRAMRRTLQKIGSEHLACVRPTLNCFTHYPDDEREWCGWCQGMTVRMYVRWLEGMARKSGGLASPTAPAPPGSAAPPTEELPLLPRLRKLGRCTDAPGENIFDLAADEIERLKE
jgi:hypothetical protein